MSDRLIRGLYASTVFLSALLLFQLQPLAARFLLPRFGGAAGVWTVCMLFFEALLVAGYGYAHALIRFATPRTQARVHLVLLLLAAGLLGFQRVHAGVPLLGGPWQPDPERLPALHLLGWLLRTVGLPYFVLSTTGPLVQAWFRRRLGAAVPYRLFALSNAGSLLGLLGYPLLTERYLALGAQALAWSAAFVAFAALCGACAWVSKQGEVPATAPAKAAVGQKVWLWVALAAAPSAMLLASTNQLSQQVAAVPFLWVVPLSLYLVSFIVCFDRPRWYRRAPWTALLAAGIVLLRLTENASLAAQVGAHGLMLFALCMVCHGELVRAQPPGEQLTLYFLAVASGGALGGLLVALGAPVLFCDYVEFPLGLWLACALIVAVFWRSRQTVLSLGDARVGLLGLLGLGALGVEAFCTEVEPARRLAAHALAGCAAVALWLLARRRYDAGLRRPASPRWSQATALLALVALGSSLWRQQQAVAQESIARSRSFFGALRVREFEAGAAANHLFALMNGNTLHGFQYTAATRRAEPTSYYDRTSGIGLALAAHPRRRRGDPMRVGVVGLGVGTLGAYARAGDQYRFYELNPEVIRLARGAGGYFQYLSQSAGTMETIPGDARISLERERDRRFDLLVLDAFSGHAIPMHLLTREAFALYGRLLDPAEGVIAVHVTNHFLDLPKVVGALAALEGLAAVEVKAQHLGDDHWGSDWVLLARNPALLHAGELGAQALPLEPSRDPRFAWTDSYGNLLAVMRARQ